MPKTIGIRREDKSIWERRVPITPKAIAELKTEHDIEAWIQPSSTRVIPDSDFERQGALLKEDLSLCDVVFGVKEIPAEQFRRNGAYVFFSHVIKGQAYNMPMLRDLLEKGCTLIDYEKVADSKGKRLIFFGRHAGAAGAIETLHALGRRLFWEGTDNPFLSIKRAYEYPSLTAAKKAVYEAGRKYAGAGLPEHFGPFVLGVAGYGNVGQGVLEVLNELPVKHIDPAELETLYCPGCYDPRIVYCATFKEEHMVGLNNANNQIGKTSFDYQHYYANPGQYSSIFDRYWPRLSVLINAVYWDAPYPRLITKKGLAQVYNRGESRLKVIGDVSCDIEGSIEVTVKSTEPGDPCFVYNPETGAINDGFEGAGVVVMAVDILPSELPLDSSESFCEALKPYIPAIANADYSVDFEALDLPPEIKKAVIVHKGRLTPAFEYLSRHLEQEQSHPKE
ncbi:MAG: bifunctional lysine ketoglutarate reductase /saccharopine dehydrogenase family protein [Spirochaetia bacterium]|jgi:alpha-aminoadipic semialdehyde synthase|nr:bifunctional lysine ketoglutarate reductase /saccharopine dehydrogenase family protein [Spirochaetia bacterium]